MDLLDKLRAVGARAALFDGQVCRPFDTVFDEVLGPCEVRFAGRRVLMFGSNNYFGLSFHPGVQAAAQDAVGRYGSGSTGSRVANGTLRIHEELERDFAETFGKRYGMIFSTGFQANLCLVAGLCSTDDTILLDAACHASIYDGARLSGASVVREDVRQAVIRAVLAAVNRRLEPLIADVDLAATTSPTGGREDLRR